MGPNAACAFAIRRASAGDGGWKRVIGRSSCLDFSPVAVVRLMVGNDKVAAGEGGLKKLGGAPGCNVAESAVFDLGEVEKN